MRKLTSVVESLSFHRAIWRLPFYRTIGRLRYKELAAGNRGLAIIRPE